MGFNWKQALQMLPLDPGWLFPYPKIPGEPAVCALWAAQGKRSRFGGAGGGAAAGGGGSREPPQTTPWVTLTNLLPLRLLRDQSYSSLFISPLICRYSFANDMPIVVFTLLLQAGYISFSRCFFPILAVSPRVWHGVTAIGAVEVFIWHHDTVTISFWLNTYI